ncbi:FecR domain-containing protein [Rhizobium sp. LjRoot98]|uniref:FecR family protein n=1 Tax=Rhizobium sp. LjRoot98 TaxID=3342345 RepID=UPI003ECC956B
MFAPYRVGVIAFGLLAFDVAPLKAVESIGKAVEIKTAVTGTRGDLSINDPVFQDERIRTSKSGLGQFIFRDGTKLAVGWGSSVVVDKFVFDGSNSVKKLTIKAAKGTFRWVSGKSNHTAYEILTPAGTIGVRGTAFDFYIGGDGTTAVVLLGGAASFCGAGGCRQLTRRCDYVVARRSGAVTDVRRVDRGIFTTLGTTKALPFLSGSQKLTASGGYGGCGLARAVDIKPNDVPKQVRPTPKEQKPDRDKPDRDKPDKDKPDKDKPDRDKPDRDKPDRDRPDHDRPDHDRPDHDRNHDKNDRGNGDRNEPDRPGNR